MIVLQAENERERDEVCSGCFLNTAFLFH